MTFEIFFEQKFFFTSLFKKKRVFAFEGYLKQIAANS